MPEVAAAAPALAASAIPEVGAEVGGTTLAALPGLTEAAGAAPGAFLGAAGSSAEPLFAGAAQGPWPFLASSPDFAGGGPGAGPVGGGGLDMSRFGGLAMDALKSLASFLRFGKRAGLEGTAAFPFAAPDTGTPPAGGYAGGGLIEPLSRARLVGGSAGPSAPTAGASTPSLQQGGSLSATPGGDTSGSTGSTEMQALMALLQSMGGA